MKVFRYKCSDGNGGYYNGNISATNKISAEATLTKKYHSILQLFDSKDYENMTDEQLKLLEEDKLIEISKLHKEWKKILNEQFARKYKHEKRTTRATNDPNA